MAADTDLVHVVLIDTATTTVVADDRIPANLMPETFAKPTTLHLGGRDWRVERAEPVTRAELLATGELTVWMREVKQVAPDQIRFTLPTLETLLPPFAEAPPPGALEPLWMHEDDWRQRELVAAHLAPAIAAELADIRSIYAHQRIGAGFRAAHVRTRIPEPLAGRTLTLAELAPAAPRPVALGPARGPGSVVAGGFAGDVEGCAVYGRTEAGVLVAVGLSAGTPGPRLAAVAHAHGLVLVDWIAATQARVTGGRFVPVPE